MTEADEALIERSQRGDRAAFEELVRRTARLVYARIALDAPDRHRAEDLAQEVYLIAWRLIGRLQHADKLRPWLMTIAASVLTDDARHTNRKKRGPHRAGSTSLETLPDATASPASAAEATEERLRALEALRSLPEEYRQPLTLRYLAGADYDAIARQLALSNGSLRGLLHRGLAMLRKKMTDEI